VGIHIKKSHCVFIRQYVEAYQIVKSVIYHKIIANVSGTSKRKQVITALQQQGEVVAFTSCRTDEAELLTTADVGIARGTEATNVAKAAADLILLEDNFAKIGTAIREGRRLRGEKAGMLVYLLLYSGSILAVGCGGLLGLLPLTYCAPLLLGLHLTLSALPTPILLVFGISNTVQKLCKKR
jgi:P-type E1-E2 ATPase